MTNREEFCILLLLREAEPAPAFKPVVSQSCSLITQVEAHQSRLDGGRSLCLRLIHHQSPDRAPPWRGIKGSREAGDRGCCRVEAYVAASSTPHPPSELFIKRCETQVAANLILTFPADLRALVLLHSLTDGSSLPLWWLKPSFTK